MPLSFDLFHLLGYVLAWAIPVYLTYIADKKNPHRPSIIYRIFSSGIFAYLALVWWEQFKGVNINLVILKFQPFKQIQPFIGFMSYIGTTLFKEADKLKARGWKGYVIKVLDKLKANLEDKS
jgi:hypothetical protein